MIEVIGQDSVNALKKLFFLNLQGDAWRARDLRALNGRGRFQIQ
jgi:hypothetical protein